MRDRINQIMEHEQLKAARFAEEIEVQRATLSHALSGRNNPSLEIITKILQRFPEINGEWLLLGKGKMVKEKTMGDLFTTTSLFPDEEPEVPEYRKEIEPKQPEITIEPPQMQEIKVIEKPTRNVSRIMLFYSDNTYDTFIPEDQEDK
ncbi:DNA-binding XRE family transcriptional regulator [Parabacteroides sp. PFB2-12]|uniref:helix-turn-helix domain-containing protein n=1 Tax=unclassified Parabacteroides TaxID=2649774 RepID=UPI0024747F7D|nr:MULTISPECIES: helix-turn-helix transcriptional regulator [unclassified Parabacteroides]MDH6343671.1 DNA-binding XRE family transcriptional regulator [Parabacteroides sp. PM6-13]MDH6391307.1 DNA-binding XRE family transcriptional regulator [Parabacteroides sp. PFB2-12]